MWNRTTELDIRRAFTSFQLMTILEENHHSFLIVEHEMLYEDAKEMVEYVAQALADASKEAAVLLYSPGLDPFLEELALNADRVWYFEEGPRDSHNQSLMYE
jgi:hypothetical protein